MAGSGVQPTEIGKPMMTPARTSKNSSLAAKTEDSFDEPHSRQVHMYNGSIVLVTLGRIGLNCILCQVVVRSREFQFMSL